MKTLLVESVWYGWIIILMFFLAFGVPVILLIVGIAIRSKRKKMSNIILIITVLYAIIGLGVCGGLMI